MNKKAMLLSAGIAAASSTFAVETTHAPITAAASTNEAAGSSSPAAAAENPGTNAPSGFLEGKLPEAIARGKFSLNVRPRWEHAWQSGLKESDAFTIRTRLGYTTAPLYGFQAMLEAENIAAVNANNNYNDLKNAADGGRGRTVIPDAPTTELNQAWLSYTNWGTLVRGGRQRLTLDNHRFIGDSGWRQNMQTFDAVEIENRSLPCSTFFYAYLWDVHRVYGDFDTLPAANGDFRSDSHLFHYSYEHWKWLKLAAYTYLLDFRNDIVANPNSTATYGGFVGGTVPVAEEATLDYRGEFAWQTDYARNPASYSAPYYNVELSATRKPFTAGAGYEVLGSDHGMQGVKTPLATLHAFNGWADVFLNTPATGLRDTYAFAGVTLPGEVPIRLVLHDFRADDGDIHYGDEVDVIASKKFAKYWTATAKYAHFDGKDAPTSFDADKFWLQLEFAW